MNKVFSKVFLGLILMSTIALCAGLANGNDQLKEKASYALVISIAGAGIAVAPKMDMNFGFQWTRTEETLINYLSKGNSAEGNALRGKFLNGEYRFRDYVLYRALLIDGFQGIQRIWDNTISRTTGVCNVEKAKLEKDVTVCIDTILVEYANSGGAGTDPAAITAYDSVVTAWPVGMVQAELHITQDSNPILEYHPLSTCGSPADSQFAKGRADGYALKNPFILEGDKPFEVRIDFPSQIVPTNTDFLKISLFGVGTRKRGMI